MVLYRSFYDAIKLLPDDTQLEIFRAIFEFGLDGIEPELSKSALPFWLLIKPNLQANRTKWESGSKAKRKQSVSKNEAKQKQKASITEANVDVDVDVDVDKDKDENEYDDKDDNKKKSKQFIPPTYEEVEAYFIENNESLNYLPRCYHHYADHNWTNRDGKKVKDWKRTIKTNWFGKNQKNANTSFPGENFATWKPSHHKNLDFSNTIETK